MGFGLIHTKELIRECLGKPWKFENKWKSSSSKALKRLGFEQFRLGLGQFCFDFDFFWLGVFFGTQFRTNWYENFQFWSGIEDSG